MTLHPRTPDTDRTYYLRRFFPNIESSTILDYGGNRGNILYFMPTLDQKNYTCIDVDVEALTAGEAEWPLANWIHYDRYNWAYNHTGHKRTPLEIKQQFDYSYSYSVFSHTDFNDFLMVIKKLMSCTTKKIALSFLTRHDPKVLIWFNEKRSAEYGSCADITSYIGDNNNFSYLLNNDNEIFNREYLTKRNVKYMISFYDPDWLISRLKQENILATIDTSGDVPFLIIDMTTQ